jgi:tetratricopeptide (TPR) repeat protein
MMRDIEILLGMKASRKRLVFDDQEPHDESFSYGLCCRFYGDEKTLNDAIVIGNRELRDMIGKATPKELADGFAMVGNIHYLLGNFSQAAGYFMQGLNYDREDITLWVEFLFCLRAMGKFGLFERAIFNLGPLIKAWANNPAQELTQKKAVELICQATI